jgi:glucosamine--fructose-6-phosphate aminotransferase (isomerizing)
VATRRGSPLLVGIKSTDSRYETANFIPIVYSKDNRPRSASGGPLLIKHNESISEFSLTEDFKEVEYFFASDASAIIEHTKRVIFLEDDDVAFIKDGCLSIHRLANIKLVQRPNVQYSATHFDFFFIYYFFFHIIYE